MPGRGRPGPPAAEAAFHQHTDSEILLSFPGLGLLLAARVLAEIGDDRTRFADAGALKSYAGSAPINRASGKKRFVGRRFVKNNRLMHAGFLWAFSALQASPGANAHYRRRREHGDCTTRPSASCSTASSASSITASRHGSRSTNNALSHRSTKRLRDRGPDYPHCRMPVGSAPAICRTLQMGCRARTAIMLTGGGPWFSGPHEVRRVWRECSGSRPMRWTRPGECS